MGVERERERGGGVMSQYRHMILHHCVCVSASPLPPAESQLVVSAPAKLLLCSAQQAGSDLCMRPPERRRRRGACRDLSPPPAVPDTSVCCSPPAEVGSRWVANSDVQQLFFSGAEPSPSLAFIPSVLGY